MPWLALRDKWLPSNPKSQQASRGAKCAKVLRAAQSVGGQTVSHIRERERELLELEKRVSMETAAAAAGELLDLVPLVGLGLFLTPPPDLIVRCSQHDTTARAGTSRDRGSARLLTHAPQPQQQPPRAAIMTIIDRPRLMNTKGASFSAAPHQQIFAQAAFCSRCCSSLLPPRHFLLFALSSSVGEKERG